MSRSYWLPIIAAFGIALAGGVCAQPVGDDAGSQPSTSQAQEKPQSNDTPRILETINSGVERLNRTLEALKPQPKTAKEDEQGESDLKAQWEMARWAENMFWVALWSLILTAFGLLLLTGTLIYTKHAAKSAKAMVVQAEATTKAAQETVDEARKATKFSGIAADLARETMLTTDRPWIKITVQITKPLIFGKDTVSTSIKCIFHNVGKSPATNVSVTRASIHGNIIDAGDKIRRAISHPADRIYIEAVSFGVTLFPDETFCEKYDLEMPVSEFTNCIAELIESAKNSSEPYEITTGRPAILAGVRYIIPGDKKYRFTYLPFHIESKVRDHTGWDGKECRVSVVELRLNQAVFSGFLS